MLSVNNTFMNNLTTNIIYIIYELITSVTILYYCCINYNYDKNNNKKYDKLYYYDKNNNN